MNVLVIGDILGTPELRHEVPLGIPDSFFYAELDGQRIVAMGAMESARVDGLGTDLEVHPTEELVAGDVITIEPGHYRQELGGVRVEDLLRVTDDGYELLTDCPYDLEV
jgi:Xaa-Pro aminopeptidase